MDEYSCDNRPGVLWAAPFCLHDSSSGAAMQMRQVLQQLAKRGVRCYAISALTFDAPTGTALFSNLQEQLQDNDAQWFDVQEHGVDYRYLRTASHEVKAMTRAEESVFYQGFLHALEAFCPNVLILYGASPLEISMMAECNRRGIAVVNYIANGHYANYHFPYADLLVTESPLTARRYYENSRINLIPIGSFIDRRAICMQREHSPKYITLINPSREKGVSLFMRLALMAGQLHPDWRFLVVESRSTWEAALQHYGQQSDRYSNVAVVEHTLDMHLVYEKTKVLLAPSLWYEGFGRVVAEAGLNGIPVLTSMSGGLQATVNGGGICLHAPEKCQKNYSHFPTADELGEWFSALESLMDDSLYFGWQAKAREASSIHDIEMNTNRLMHYLAPLLQRSSCFHPQYYRS